jgi:SAM-dependent methyltransferase
VIETTTTITLNYYNLKAVDFTTDTIDVSFTVLQETFLAYLKKTSKILDFGCGSGRDTKYFLTKGHSVDAIDGSKELCKIASEYTGIQVKQMLFNELTAIEEYDGIWACSSILHLPYEELVEVMKKMKVALKDTGIIYTSFKYGNFEGVRNGRYFIDMTEESLEKMLQDVGGLDVEDMWVTSDVRPGRGEEKWLNLFLRKK